MTLPAMVNVIKTVNLAIEVPLDGREVAGANGGLEQLRVNGLFHRRGSLRARRAGAQEDGDEGECGAEGAGASL